MACGNCGCGGYYVAVNTASQPFVAAGTNLNPGARATAGGCGLALLTTGIQINNAGTRLYEAESTVTFTPSAAGTVTLQMYLNGAALPCTLRQMTVAADTEYTLTTHASAFLSGSCSMIKPVVSVVIGGVAGTVNWMSESVKT